MCLRTAAFLVAYACIGMLSCATRSMAATDNQLSTAEREAGWQLLFNGVDHDGWKCNNGEPIATPVEDGALLPFESGGYVIVHEKPHSDFILKCDVKWESEPCNSGIFFRIADLSNPVHTGFEMQVMSGNGTGKHDGGAIYDLAAPVKNAFRKAGEWNTIEIRCQGPNIAVTVNDELVTQMDCDDYDEPGLCPDGHRHKYQLENGRRAIKDFAHSGYLGFQDHGQKVWYKNVKLLPLTEN